MPSCSGIPLKQYTTKKRDWVAYFLNFSVDMGMRGGGRRGTGRGTVVSLKLLGMHGAGQEDSGGIGELNNSGVSL